ncbi:ferritin-like fold-containing protein [Micromonospora sp. NPDC049282]|uniref:ferritin-like fold-containing protein n=1 Tax=Micromonospora sp. NPDC049282 TaxID=3364269 RepID=UPI00371873BB
MSAPTPPPPTYVEALRGYHDSTEPRDWAEAVTKAYVGDAITDDFLRRAGVDAPTLLRGLTGAHAARMAAAGLNN